MDNVRSFGVRNVLAPFLLSIGQGDAAVNLLRFPATFDLIGSKFHLVHDKAQNEIIELIKKPMDDVSAARIKELLLSEG